MPQLAPFSGAKLYDGWNTDELLKVGDLLDDINGVKTSSNTRIFDRLLQTSNTQILALQSQLSDLIQNNYIIHCVNLVKDTTITSNSSYTGIDSSISELQENFLYVLNFDITNTGNIQININGFGYTSAFKIDSGSISEFLDNEIKAGIYYLFLIKNNQFIFVGENNEQRFENLQESIANTNTNLMTEITARDPQNKRTDAYLASNHDMTGFTVPASYSPITATDNVLSSVEKLVAQQTEQDADISALEQQVETLRGAVIFLGNIDENTADITQPLLTSRAQQILTDRGVSTDLKQGYTLVDLDSNDWWYDETDAIWVNIGFSAITTATNSSLGVVKGSTANGNISINADGIMAVNGGQVQNIVEGTNIDVNNSDPANPVVSVKASPTFTGTPKAPTPATSNNSTQLATTAFVKAALLAMWPVGSIYMSMSSANPSTFIGGTWARIAQGRTLVGVNESDADFNAAYKTWGSKDVTLIPANIPPLAVSTQVDNGTTSNLGTGLAATDSPVLTNKAFYSAATVIGYDLTVPAGRPFSNLQPYLTCYIWQRTA